MTETPQPGHVLERTVFFGEAEVQGAGLVLSGGNLTCIFGHVRCDFRNAELLGAEVELTTLTLFGNLELRVPVAWRVLVEVRPLLGNVMERGLPASPAAGAPTLRLSGNAIFGNVELERF